jgi:enoyl-CoA hydratase/carnithine racemase
MSEGLEMDLKYIKYEKEDHIARITLNRPDVLNALHPPATAELNAVWTDFRDDSHLWVAIIRGAGEKAFCVGDDLKYRVNVSDDNALRQSDVHPNYTPVNCFKPIIAEVNGYAMGGGLEIVLGCDIIIASDTARFGLPEARRGLLADAGGVIQITRRIPHHLAMGMILTGKLFSACEMYRMGLVNEVASPQDLSSVVERWVTDVLACSPHALQAAKQVVSETGQLHPKVAADQMEGLHRVRMLRESEDYLEGPRAFSEKRTPVWTNPKS